MRRSAFIFLLAAPLFAQPTVTNIYNNYSGTRQGLPNFGISPGSLFVIAGFNLATTTNTTEAFPLTTNLGGTSVSVTVNGVTTQPTLYYILPTQIGAVLPEGTPLGSGTLTVTSGGQTGQPVPILVVQSAFGILTDNGAGFGPAAAFDTNYTPINATHPATPGELIAFWGTGAGPDPANDDRTEPQQTNNLTSVPMSVYVGGVSATVFYKGRSAYPGVDEIFIYVPATTPLGCYVSVVMVSGTITSNYATIPVAAQGASSCTDQISVLGDWQTLEGKSTANLGILEVLNKTTQTATQPQVSSMATGDFKTDSAVQVYSELFSDALVSAGSCVVDQGNSTGTPAALNAGQNLSITGPGGEQALFNYPTSAFVEYSATLPSGFISSSGSTITINGAGGSGAQVGSFTVPLTIPAAITWTNMSAASSIVRGQGFTVNWTGGAAGEFVAITGDSTGTAGVDVKFECIAPASAGTFTIPSEVLLSLPNTTTSAKLGVANFGNPVTFSATGLDLGFAYGGFDAVTQLANYQATAVTMPQLSSVTFAATATASGTSIQGTVTLSSPAPPAGAVVTLASSSALVSVPASVTIPAGAITATFTATAGTVAAATNVTITASYSGSSTQVVLTVNPPNATPSFDGTYTGSYSGRGSGQSVSGSVTATVAGGTVSVTEPANGTGTITTNGDISFGVVIAGGTSCNFSGQITVVGAAASGSGTFSCTSPTFSGTWNVSRQ
jgi:uncharacterized protein (TIGR03437 family)